MPGQFAPSPKNRTLRVGGSRVLETGPEERGRLSGPHQIAVRTMYKIPLRTNSAPSNVRNILASQFIAAARTPVGSSADSFLRGELTPRVKASSPPLQLGGFFFWIWGFGKLLTLPFKFLFFRRDRPRKSGGPPLFEPSLKVQRDVAHCPPPRSCAGAKVLTLTVPQRSTTAPRGISVGRLCDGNDREPAGQNRTGGLPGLGKRPIPEMQIGRTEDRVSEGRGLWVQIGSTFALRSE